jgi:hypothetical protein
MQKADASNVVYAQLKSAFSNLSKISPKNADKAYSLFRTVELDIEGSRGTGVGTGVRDLGVVIVSAICVRNGVSTDAADAAAAKIGPRKTRLFKIFAEAGFSGIPDILCSTDGYRHDYSDSSGLDDSLEEAAKLLRPIIKTKPVGHIGQYILLKLSSGTRSPAGDFYIYLSTLNYQLMQRSITAGVPEPFIVPITTSSSTVVPNTKIYFPLLFISQKKINNNNIFPKFSFTNHPGKQQLVYTVTREFQIQHPKNSRPPRLSSDKKSVFLTREIVAKNLEPIAKTVPISLL